MGLSYTAVAWNRQKKIYDWLIFGFCSIYLLTFILITAFLNPEYTFETVLLRSTSTLALLLLHLILSIGPLTRINLKFLPLLYNRRHLGVTMFFISLVHAGFGIFQFHALGNLNPFVSLFVSNTQFNSISQFPFQGLGFVALIILFLMAVTSHDFWLHQLGPRVWKALHMFVYLAYLLIVFHVMLGVIQSEAHPVYIGLMAIGACWLISIHLIAGIREIKKDRTVYNIKKDGWVYVCDTDQFTEGRARIFCVESERIAVFLHEGNLYAIHNVCKHQGGPLGEGKILDGCITCPWHGYQYLPASGESPPPFQEKVCTYNLRVEGKSVWLNPIPNPEGAARPAFAKALAEKSTSRQPPAANPGDEFYIGWERTAPTGTAKFIRRLLAPLALLFLAFGFLLAILQKPFGKGSFEFGTLTTVKGYYYAFPIPLLKLQTPTDLFGRSTLMTIPLIGVGKFGADGIMKALAQEQRESLEGKELTLKGTLLYNDGKTLLQVDGNDKPLLTIGGSGPDDTLIQKQDLGVLELRGEIVDPKCFFGVMKPGEGKTHKDCAIRCISGGMPPVLKLTDSIGNQNYCLLVGGHGEKLNEQVRNFVAEPVVIKAHAILENDWVVLYVKDNGIARTSYLGMQNKKIESCMAVTAK